MPEYLQENENLVNQVAKKALLQVNQKPDDLDLYILQLMEWAVEADKVALRANRGAEQQKQVFEELRVPGGFVEISLRIPLKEHWKRVMRVFEVNPGDPEEPSELVYLAQQKRPLSAVKLAQEGWEQLADWMSVNGMWEESSVLGDLDL